MLGRRQNGTGRQQKGREAVYRQGLSAPLKLKVFTSPLYLGSGSLCDPFFSVAVTVEKSHRR